MATSRDHLIRWIADTILALPPRGVLRVCIDGDAGAGKTTLGDELASALESSNRPVIRASVDGFHNRRTVRYQRGNRSPEGFFRDSYDYAILIDKLLSPLAPGGSMRFQRMAFDHRTDSAVEAPEERAVPGSILLFDGIFLHRPELRGYWDYTLFLDVTAATGLARCAARGDGSRDPLAESNRRYVEGHRLYLAECTPHEFASMVIGNEDLENPRVTRLNKAGAPIRLSPRRTALPR